MYSRHGIVFSFFLLFFFFFFCGLTWLLLSPSRLPLLSLTHYLRISISLFHTPLTSPSTVFIFSLYLNSIFNLVSLPPFKALSIFPFSPRYPPCGMSFHLSRIFYSLLSSSSPCFSSPTRSSCLSSSSFFFTDASLRGRVCSEYLKSHLPPPLRSTCPSCSMWRSQTLEPQFWAPLTSSACWDTTVMYPSWSKVGL